MKNPSIYRVITGIFMSAFGNYDSRYKTNLPTVFQEHICITTNTAKKYTSLDHLTAAEQPIWEITPEPFQTNSLWQDDRQSLGPCQLIWGQYFSQMLPGEYQFPDIFWMIFILPAGYSSGSTAWRTQPDGPIKDGLPARFGLAWAFWALPWG